VAGMAPPAVLGRRDGTLVQRNVVTLLVKDFPNWTRPHRPWRGRGGTEAK